MYFEFNLSRNFIRSINNVRKTRTELKIKKINSFIYLSRIIKLDL